MDVTQGPSVNGRLFSPLSLAVAVSFWLYPADEQTVCNYWKLFLLTDNTSFCGKKQLGGHITSAGGQRRALVPPRMSSEWDIYWKRNWKLRACSIFHTMLALIDGGPARLKSNDSRNDICERLQRILELLCFSQCRAEVLCRHELATNELLMMGCQDCCERELGPLGRNNNGQQPQQWAQNGGKYPPKKNIQSRRKLLCCVLCHKQGNFGFLCS